MNETIECITTRRSIRKYKNIDIKDEDIQEILMCAMSAPSARNQQPWYFCVIKNKEVLNTIAQNHPFAKMLYDAPLAIAVCGYVQTDMQKNYWVHDCSCATQNILLSAHSKGIGSVWVSVHPREERMAMVKEVLDIKDETIQPLVIVALGYPDEIKSYENRYDKNKISYIE